MAGKNKDKEFAIIGLGRFGGSLARRLEEIGHSVLVADIDPTLVQEIADEVTHAVVLDATNQDALAAVDITSFAAVIVTMGEDFEANLMITAALKDLGVQYVICKTGTDRQRDILLRIGADQVIQPEKDSGERLADDLSAPAMLDRLKLASQYSIAKIRLPGNLAQRSLAQSELEKRYRLTLLLISRGDEVILSPPSDTILLKGDLLVVLGDDRQINILGQSQ